MTELSGEGWRGLERGLHQLFLQLCVNSRTPKSLITSTVITDDPIRQKTTIGKLKKGTQVTCLAEYNGWIYVEDKVSGKTARGFITPSSLGLAD